MASVKASARALFAPELGGSYATWKARPLALTLVKYCTDAHTFFALRRFYASAEGRHAEALKQAAARRLVDSSDRGYERRPSSKLRAVDPALVREVRSGGGALTAGAGLYGVRSTAPVLAPAAAPAALEDSTRVAPARTTLVQSPRSYDDDDSDDYDNSFARESSFTRERYSPRDYTACDKDDCGYCGRCHY